MNSVTKIDVPPSVLAASDEQIISRLAESLSLGRWARTTRVGDKLWYLDRAGIVRAALFREAGQVWLYDFDGDVARINWGMTPC